MDATIPRYTADMTGSGPLWPVFITNRSGSRTITRIMTGERLSRWCRLGNRHGLAIGAIEGAWQ